MFHPAFPALSAPAVLTGGVAGLQPATDAASTVRVWLVGAGPGDPELLTLKAARLIAQAEVILVDDLVDRRVLSLAAPQTRIVEVGKRGGCPSTAQDFIERLMVREARAGRRVVRLKGGDPMLFGRAGEELDALRAQGVAVEVVPGVTAALGAAAALGCSLTDRRASQGVLLVTGHAQPGGSEPDWAALAATGLTLVVYMGLQRAATIAAALISAGRPPEGSAALVVDASLPGEVRHLTTLGALAAGHPAAVRGRPGLLLIGDIVAGAAAWQARHEALDLGRGGSQWAAA